MRNAPKVSRRFVLGLAALGACQKQPQPEQNIVIDINAAMANADIETLPSDESSETPSNELVNGERQSRGRRPQR